MKILNYIKNRFKAAYEELTSPDEMLTSSIEHYPKESELNKLVNPEDITLMTN